MTSRILGVALFVLSLSGCATTRAAQGIADAYFDAPECTVFFTTGLDEHEEPSDSLKQIGLNEDKVYLYVKWFGIPNGKYQYACSIFDGSGTQVDYSTTSFTVDNEFRNTWTWHRFNAKVEAPGVWRFQIRLNGRSVLERTLEVVGDEAS